jgi:hypothetical protein
VTLEIQPINFTKPYARWSPEEDAFLKEHYLSNTRTDISAALGRSEGSIRSRCLQLGLNHKRPAVTDEERELIREWYEARKEYPGDKFDLQSLADQLGRTKAVISRVAGQLGLTTRTRSLSADARHIQSVRQKNHIRIHGHPRGMLDKHHSDEFKRAQSVRSKRYHDSLTPLEVAIRVSKALATKIKRYGTGNPSMRGLNSYSRTKSGKRSDLNNQFFRSAWEANYARYLNFLIAQGEIASWEYEPETFVFHGVTRGVISYTPDFKVIASDGSYEWHEVKGWMDDKSKAKLKRMAKFYPDEQVIVIGSDEYRAIAKWSSLVDGWE